ncbi:DUF1835 domain-containing protein [Ruminococcaceae bacterium OttesenSCG-928-N02]|nr:DUF1835 domain-containing protein [Ruminococcaceae bacterium OttesenSCG-928-N02]
MIELIFSDSGAAALGIAKKTGDKSSLCVTEISTDHEGNEAIETYAPEPYSGPFIDGDFSDIAAIWLMGDVGDISILPDWSSRLKILREISDTHEMEPDSWIEQEGQRANELVKRLEDAANSGESVRIWWSDLADEACGYYWAMSILRNANGSITSVKIPRIWPVEDGYSIVSGTRELDPQDFHALLKWERAVEPSERKAAAYHWNNLVSENAPLRAMINGIPCSVPDCFYDYILYQVFPEKEFKVAEAIGRALGRAPGCARDFWYANRIRHMIACGELEIVEAGKKFYYTTIRKTTK